MSEKEIPNTIFLFRPTMYEDVEFEVISTMHVPSVILQLFSKGLLQISQKIPLAKGKTTFTILPKFSYTPKAHCIVFYIDDRGEVISDTITLHFEEILPNHVSSGNNNHLNW